MVGEVHLGLHDWKKRSTGPAIRPRTCEGAAGASRQQLYRELLKWYETAKRLREPLSRTRIEIVLTAETLPDGRRYTWNNLAALCKLYRNARSPNL